MNHLIDEKVTVTIDGDERDVFVRCHVNVEPGLGVGGSIGVELDGEPMVLIGHDGFCPIASVNLGPGDVERITEALELAAIEYDGGLDADEYFDRAAAE